MATFLTWPHYASNVVDNILCGKPACPVRREGEPGPLGPIRVKIRIAVFRPPSYARDMRRPRLHDEREWPYVLTLLPPDLEDSARQSEALIRCRNVPDAAALLRMALAYAVSDLSLKDVAAWANALGLAQITGPGLFYRLREAEAWLQHLLAQTLQSQLPAESASRLRSGGRCHGAARSWGDGYGMAGARAD